MDLSQAFPRYTSRCQVFKSHSLLALAPDQADVTRQAVNDSLECLVIVFMAACHDDDEGLFIYQPVITRQHHRFWGLDPVVKPAEVRQGPAGHP